MKIPIDPETLLIVLTMHGYPGWRFQKMRSLHYLIFEDSAQDLKTRCWEHF